VITKILLIRVQTIGDLLKEIASYLAMTRGEESALGIEADTGLVAKAYAV
jgi:hypothetical protein